MPRGVRVLTVGAIGALLVALTGAVFEDRAELQILRGQISTLRAKAASPARITITRLDPSSPTETCETILNESDRPLSVRTEIEGTVPDPSRDVLGANQTTMWCVDLRR